MFTGPIRSHSACVAPHFNVDAVVAQLPSVESAAQYCHAYKQRIHILYVGFRYIWPLFALAEARRDLDFFGFDEDFSVVGRARTVAGQMHLTNLYYLDTNVNSMRKRRGTWKFAMVLFAPPLFDTRDPNKVRTGRIRNIANCYDLLQPGGTLLMHAAMGDRAHATLEVPATLSAKIWKAFTCTGLRTQRIDAELANVHTMLDAARFLLTYASRIYAEHAAPVCPPECARYKNDQMVGKVSGLPLILHQGQEAAMAVHIGEMDLYTTIVQGVGCSSVVTRDCTPDRLSTFWRTVFDFDEEQMGMLLRLVSSLLVGIK